MALVLAIPGVHFVPIKKILNNDALYKKSVFKMEITDYNNHVSPFICLSYWSPSRSERLTFFVLFG